MFTLFSLYTVVLSKVILIFHATFCTAVFDRPMIETKDEESKYSNACALHLMAASVAYPLYKKNRQDRITNFQFDQTVYS